MDPLTFLIGAISAGALAGSTEVGKAAVVDAYATLTGYLKGLFKERGRQEGGHVLEEFERDPDSWADRLREELEAVQAGDDEELICLARKIEDAKDGTKSQQKYNTTFHGNVGTAVVGDRSEITITTHKGGSSQETS